MAIIDWMPLYEGGRGDIFQIIASGMSPNAPAGTEYMAIGNLIDVKFVRKTANEEVASSTTLQNDDQLLFPIAANETWIFRMIVFYRGSTSGDLKVGLTAPSGASKFWIPGGHSAGTTANSGNWAAVASTADAPTAAFGAMASDGTADDALYVDGIVVNGANAGNVTLQWAQNGSNVTATTVLANSYILAFRVA